MINFLVGHAAAGVRPPVLWTVEGIARELRCSAAQVQRNLTEARRQDLRLEIVRVASESGRGVALAAHGALLTEASAARAADAGALECLIERSGQRVRIFPTRRSNLTQGVSGVWKAKLVNSTA